MTPAKGPPRGAVADDPRLVVARARLEHLDTEDAADAHELAVLEARRLEREEARRIAAEEKRAADAEAEAERLRRDIPAAGRELETLGRTVRDAFRTIATTLPELLESQNRYDMLHTRADALRALGHQVSRKRVAALGRMDRKVCELLLFASRAQQGVENRR